MNELDRYGTPAHRYEGTGQINYIGAKPTPIRFDVRHIDDGRVILGCVSEGGPLYAEAAGISGQTTTGEKLWISGGITGIFKAPGDVETAHYVCREIRVRHGPDLEPVHRSIHFALFGFVYEPQDEAHPGDLTIETAGHRIMISPADEYATRYARLRSYGGIAHTAWCEIVRVAEDEGLSASTYRLVDDLMTPLSLALGSPVSWHYSVARDFSGSVTDVVHYSEFARPFSNVIVNNRLQSNFGEVVKAWFSNTGTGSFTRDDLAIRIRQHLDGCAPDTYLETRALSAATLLDVLAGRYAEIIGTANAVDPEEWRRTIFPSLKAALDTADNLSAEQRISITRNVEHQYRQSFRSNLRRLLSDTNITIGNRPFEKVYKARNALVHTGHFSSGDRDSQQTEYLNLLILSRNILLRLVGCTGDLHPLKD